MNTRISKFTYLFTVLILLGVAASAASAQDSRPKSDVEAIGEVGQGGGKQVQSRGIATFGLG